MAGNLLGPRGRYVYVSDDLTSYAVTTDVDLAIAGLGTGAGAPDAFDPANPPPNFGGRFPRGAKTRKVYVQDAAGNRKALTAFTPSAGLYQTNVAQQVTIDTVVFTSTGRVGETYSF